MILELTPNIKKWLDTEPAKRDLMEGADLLLRVTRNRILYANVTRNIKVHAEAIEYHLKKIYNQRVQDITHEQVSEMMKQVDSIAKVRGLNAGASSNSRTEFQRGKRADHDELPPEVQQLYVTNNEIRLRMRDAHTKLRLISPENSTCPDNDRFPIAKYIIELNNQYLDNWNLYDHYVKGTPISETVLAVDERTASKNAEKLCHLLLGKYNKAKDADLAARIRESYAKILSPSANLRKKMRAADLL